MAFVARHRILARGWRGFASLVGVAAYALLHAPASTQPAVADGDTRTLTFVNNHTNESGSFTYRVNGRYDQDALDKLNWFMRDWRLNEQTKMDPQLFDILWEVYQQAGSSQPIDVLSGYRSPQTNAMLHRRSRLVASKSQHMQGKAIDAHFLDIGTGRIRDVAMRMQEGGVGFYPIGSTPWVHIDSGTVRYWPRMNRSALARLFPDGKTVFIPSDGQPMDGYAEAKAMIEARGGDVQTASNSGGGLLGWLFGGARGGGEDDAEESGGARMVVAGRGGGAAYTAGARSAPASPPEPAAVAQAPAAVTQAPPPPEATAPEAATDPEAPPPMPPRKPTDLLADFDLAAPLPPRRPVALAPESLSADDLIATMIERSKLPGAIVKGAPGAPKSALALVAARRSDAGDPAALARAAALAMPPLPPRRPRRDESSVTKVEKVAPPPPRARPVAANPFGSLVIDAFNAPAPVATDPAPVAAGPALVDLRGSTP